MKKGLWKQRVYERAHESTEAVTRPESLVALDAIQTYLYGQIDSESVAVKLLSHWILRDKSTMVTANICYELFWWKIDTYEQCAGIVICVLNIMWN